MAQQTIFLGTNANDGTGESLRGGGSMINSNFTELYALQSDTINAGAVAYNFSGATTEQRIALAEADAVLLGKSRVRIPASMIPYDITLCPATAGIQRVREGGNDSVYEPEAYGAEGDVVRNDFDEVQACINAAATRGTVVLNKKFLCQSRLLIPSSTEITGLGWQAGLKFDWTFASGEGGATYIQNSDTVNGNTNIVFRNFTIEGIYDNTPYAASPTRAGGILFRRGSDIQVVGCRFYRVMAICIAHQGISRANFSNNVIYQCGRDGITGGPFAATPTADVVVSNNTIREVGDDAIAINSSVDTGSPGTARPIRVAITGNTIFGRASNVANLAGRGIFIAGGEDISVVGNNISDTFAAGINLQADTVGSNFTTRNCTVTGNVVRRAGQAGDGTQPQIGIRLVGTLRSSVVGNDVVESNQTGILVGDNGQAFNATSDITVTGNTVAGCGTAATDFAISVAAGLASGVLRVEVSNNTVTGNMAGGISVSGASHVLVAGNHVTNNGQFGTHSGNESGIRCFSNGLTGLVMVVRDNYCTDTQSSKTQTFGFTVSSHATVIGTLVLQDNYLKGNFTSGIAGEVSINTMPTTLVYRRDDPTQSLSFNATLSPNALAGEYVEVGALTGNVTTINAPSNNHKGARLRFRFLQDGTGGKTVAGWNAVYRQAWADTGNTAGLYSVIEFVSDGTNWIQVAAQGPYV